MSDIRPLNAPNPSWLNRALHRVGDDFGQFWSLPPIRIITYLLSLLLLVSIIWGGMFTVAANEWVLVMRLGEPERVVGSGSIYLKVPYFDSAVRFSRGIQEVDRTGTNAPTTVLTRDGYDVDFFYDLKWREQAANLGWRWQNILYPDDTIASASRTILKEVVAGYSMDQIITSRPAITEAVMTKLKGVATTYKIELVDFFITNIALSDTFKKVVATRELAKARADALTALSMAIQPDPNHLAIMEGLAKWDGKGLSTVAIGPGGVSMALPAGK